MAPATDKPRTPTPLTSARYHSLPLTIAPAAANPYFDHLRSKCPVVREPNYGVLAITGYDEANTVLKDTDTFSSCIAVGGPFPPLPFTPEGDDISELIATHRNALPLFEHMVTMDPPDHTNARSLLNRLLTRAG